MADKVSNLKVVSNDKHISKIIEDISSADTAKYMDGFATPSNKKEYSKHITKKVVEYNEILHLELDCPILKPGTMLGPNKKNLHREDIWPGQYDDGCMEKCFSDDIEASLSLNNAGDFKSFLETKVVYNLKPILVTGETVEIKKHYQLDSSHGSERIYQKEYCTYEITHYVHAIADGKKVHIETELFSKEYTCNHKEVDLRYIKNIYNSANIEELVKPYVIIENSGK